MKTIAINELSLIAGTQVRTIRDTPTELRYQEVMTEAGTNTMFPPIIVYRDTCGKMWIADGHHRVAASIGAGLTTIAAEVRDGTKADAIKAAVIANRHNGLPMSKSDRFNAMEMLLETQNYSNPALAELLGVSHQTIMRWREQSTCPNGQVEVRLGKDGKTRKAQYDKKPKPKPPCSPVSSPAAQPTETTTASQDSHTAQTRAKQAEEALDEHHESVWREVSECLNAFQTRIREYRKCYDDNIYVSRIHNLFEI